jgi:pilus assembly protein CpaB
VKARRRRAAVLLALALASGGLAASQVRQRERSVEERVGPLVPVLVATRDLPADARIRPGALALRRVPASYAPPDALGGVAGVAGARTAAAVAAGGYVTAGHLEDPSGDGGGAPGVALRRGERALEVAVTGGGLLAGLAPGARVDVIVSTETRDGAGRTFAALEDVELLGLRDGAGTAGLDGESGTAAAPATALATLRVTLRQAVYLTAADNFGREVRLLVRPPGDRGRSDGVATAEGEL